MTYQEELKQLRLKFSEIDTNDPDSLKEWFGTYAYLSTRDHSQVMQVSENTVRTYKYKTGIKKKVQPENFKGISVKKIVTIDVPDDWDNKKWLVQQYKIHSINSIAKAVNRNRLTIRKKLVKHGVRIKSPSESRQSTNRYYDKDWCYSQYVKMGLSLAECSKKAGVARATFARWLDRFEIPVRTRVETHTNHSRKSIWARRLMHELKQQDIVNSVTIGPKSLKVKYHTFVPEYYYFNTKPKGANRGFTVTKHNSKITKVPLVLHQYENEIGNENDYSCHLIINKKDWDDANIIEQRLAIQNFVKTLFDRDWIWPKHPLKILSQDLDKMQNMKLSKYIRKGQFTVHPMHGRRLPPHRKIIEHFYGINELEPILNSPNKIWRAFKHLTSKAIDINTHNLFRIMTNFWGPKMLDPLVYSSVFKRLGIKGKVLDISPHYGNKAIACAISKLQYTSIHDKKLQNVMNIGFADFMGLDYNEYDGETVDLAVYDNNFGHADIDAALEYADVAKKLIVFVPKEQKEEIKEYQPESIIQIKTKMYSKEPDYLFVW